MTTAVVIMDNWKTHYTEYNVDFQAMKQAVECLELAMILSTKNRSRYRQSLRNNARGLWSGVFTQAEFEQAMFFSLDRGLRQAWNLGFMEFGISPDEQDSQERQAIFNIVFEQSNFINGLASFIVANKKENGGLLRTIMRRVDLWINRYDTVFNEAKARAGANRKMEWVLGEAEHCTSCLKLSGQVRRGRVWIANGILPQVPNADYLECRGFQCQCKLEPTNKPATRGKLPQLP